MKHTDSGDWTQALYDGVPFSDVLAAAARRAQARADAEQAYQQGKRPSDVAKTWRPPKRKTA